MDYLRDELILPFVIRDRLDDAAKRRLLGAVRAASDCGCSKHPTLGLGGRLVSVGHWLEARADPCRRTVHWGMPADPCHGCAN